jgi:exopolysaccharide biosynthesis polyprenyl glycosylphosphotransferase
MNGSRLQHIAGVQHTVPDIEMTETAHISTESPGGSTGPITKALYQRRSNRRHWRIFERVATVVLDAILIGVSFWLAYYFRFTVLSGNGFLTSVRNNFGGNENPPLRGCTSLTSTCYSFSNFRLLGIGVVVGLMLIFALRGLYSIRLTGSWFRQAWTIASSTTLGLAFLITYYFVFQPPSNSRLLVPFVWAAAIVVLCLERLIVSIVMGMLYRRGFGETRLLVVGSGRLGKLMMQHIAASPSLGYAIVGFLDDMKEEDRPGDFGRFKMLGTLEDLGMVIRSMQIDEVIIALPSNLHEQSLRSVRLCERLGTSFKLVPDLYEYELSLSRINMDAIEGIPLIGIKQESLNSVQQLVTRAVDVCLSVIGLVVGLPFWVCIALAIKMTSPGVVIYRQIRIGWNGRAFKVFKFRTMYKDAEQRLDDLLYRNEAQGPLFKIKDDPRITPVGKFLRRTSFDEIPQLLNVIKGEMSLVGPRPPLPQEVATYAEWQKARLSIKPGMTGLWQVRGRSDISFDEGVLMDLYYIENWSLRLYFMILLRTIPAVLFSRGAY